ncbi:nucleotide exchange factor GrpE [Sinomonas halotolerans]|uniref:Protein GrpE n=1 Tax=Sinomonas halotolerans TaxID=1644133 RepID=A0ABU9X222_9MICC
MAPHHGNEHEHEHERQREADSDRPEPVIRDHRKVDPVTGKARHAEGEERPAEGAEHHEDIRPVDEAHDSGDALAQAEQILSEAAAGAEAAAHDAVIAELREDLLRLQAEYVNYRRRVERDRAVAGEVAVVGVLNSLLPVLDDIDAARAHGDLAEGPFAAIASKLEQALKAHGLERIGEAGVEFDPNIHEALMQQPGEGIQVDTVQQVLRSGYRTQGRVLRAAQVIVATPQ